MHAKQVLAAIAVADIDTAIGWYERLFGAPFDDRPMHEAAEWRLSDSGGVQLVADPDRAGKSMATIGVDDIDAVVAAIRSRGIDAEASPPGDGPFRLSRIPDPDGNILTFAEDRR